MKMITIFFTLLILVSCSSDYDGTEPAAQNPTIIITESGTTFVNSFVRVDWIGVIGTETDMDYYYCVTTDTAITAQTALSSLSSDKWLTTKNNYADVSFPMVAFNSDVVFYHDSVYVDPESNQIEVKIAFSKIFVYAQNSVGTRSPVNGKMYSRINKKPRLLNIESAELDFKTDDEETFLTDGKLLLPESNQYSVPVDFQWYGEDADIGSKIQYKWELWENDGKANIFVKASEWGEAYSAEINDDIYFHNPQGNYTFKVFIRDDALEQGDMNFAVNFSVFAPTFEKGILFIDDTDSTLTENPSYLYFEGNPVAEDVRNMYRSFLEDAGFTENNSDPLKDYDIVKFQVETELVRIDTTFTIFGTDTIWTYTDVFVNYYSPDLRKLSKYRLVIIASEDRSNENGIDFSGTEYNPGYSSFLPDLLNAGGKVFIIGHCALMKTQPYRMAVNDYSDPVRQIFDPSATSTTDIADVTLNFFHDYFGIYAMTFPETKTWFSQDIWDIRPVNVPVDYYMQDNYDFIGITKYDNITDITAAGIKVDSTKVNDSWRDFTWLIGPQSFLIPLSLKDNGTVLTGIPTIEAFKGEPVYKYKSIYDLPRLEGYTMYDTDENGTVLHSIRYIDPVLTDGDNSGDITRKTGSVATRYVADGDQYRTAFFAFPLFYMNNTNGEVSDMFNAMIDWFDLEKDPVVSWK